MSGTRRDPAGRRREIVAAMADLMCHGEPKITHRRVAQHAGVPLGSTTYYFASLDDLRSAALEFLAEKVDADLAETAELLDASDGSPETVAAMFHDYLSDAERVRTELVLYSASLARPELAVVSRRWFSGLVDLLSRLTDRRTALTMAVFVDGACMHAALNDEPLDLPLLQDLTRSLMTGTADRPRLRAPEETEPRTS
ncbi:MAG: TetR family transcriptional regulator [Gordonia sp. (in: high G+C Gram-positive bacteria)]|uniref:TetR/AcrR family transcriptional regulator n=1 Tax=Gordonia sp. (in: high G+C Gram-positive bacteria) TaxID=84139 RepID=UPI0039E25AF8